MTIYFLNDEMVIDYSDRLQSVTNFKVNQTSILRDGVPVKIINGDMSIDEFEREQRLILAEVKRLEKFASPETSTPQSLLGTN